MQTRFYSVFQCLAAATALTGALALAGCGGVESKAEYPSMRLPGDKDAVYGKRESIFGGSGLFGNSKEEAARANVGIAVNAYLWRAALDTISFMPIANADPFGGTILTDWYEAPEAKGERVKANILILSRELRTDGIKVSLFRQVKSGNGWSDAKVDPKTVTQLENAILTRARQLKVAQANGQ